MITEPIEAYKSWLKKHRPEVEKSSLRKLDRIVADLQRYERARKRNAAVGIYGQSQSGKSFLVDAMLAGSEEQFYIKGLDKPFRDINPDNQGEATAVTCRFTAADTRTQNKDGFFVCELLSLGELLYILLAGFEEFKLEEDTAGSIPAALDRINLKEGGSTLDRMQVYDIMYYLSGGENKLQPYGLLKDRSILNALDNRLQEALETGLTSGGLKQLCAALFRGIEDYSSFAEQLIQLYESLQMAESVLLPASRVSAFINTNNILKWGETGPEACSFGLQQANDWFEVTEAGSFNIALLQIACSELVLPVRDQSRNFLKEVDLLDFPGLRAFNQGQERSFTQESIARGIKQGKLKASFDLYSHRKEIPALIVASPFENAEAKSLPRKIRLWLDEYCTPDFAAKANRFLFFVMTKSDHLLARNWEDHLEERLQTRFKANYEAEFGEMLSILNGTPFTNVHFTRNPAFSKLPAAELGEEGMHIARQRFMQHALVRQHVGSIAETLFRTYEEEGAGTGRLTGAIDELAGELQRVKRENIEQSIRERIEEIQDDINLHLHAVDEVEEQARMKRQLRGFLAALGKGRATWAELISYFSSQFPEDWEWKEKDTEPFGFLNLDFSEEEKKEEEQSSELMNLISKYKQNLLENFTKGHLPAIHENHSAQEVKQYILACIDYFSYHPDFKAIEKQIAESYARITTDSEIENHQFRQMVKAVIISHCTGYAYQAAIPEAGANLALERRVDRKVGMGLKLAAEKSFKTDKKIDIEANQELQSIKDTLQAHV